MANDPQLIDLDDLSPKPATIKFNDTLIEVKPPQTGQLLRLGALSDKLTDVSGLRPEEIESALAAVTAEITKIIPELEGKQLNMAQLFTLIRLITDMAMPGNLKELKKQGITQASLKKAQ